MDKRLKSITYTGLMTAVVALLSVWQIPIPFLGIGLTLQTFAVSLCGYMLRGRRGALCVLCYVIIGGVGLPVFSGFRGGFSVLAGPGGGFIFGFILLSFLCGVGSAKKPFSAVALGLLGLLCCHLLGVIQYCAVTATPIFASLLSVSLPFLPKDVLCVLGGYFLSRLLLKRLKSFV